MSTRENKMKRLGRFVIYVGLVLIALSMLIPFLWMLSTSLMDELEVYQFPPRFIPSAVRWSNFIEAMSLQPFGRFFLNTMIVAAASVLGQLTFCSMAAYAFARLQFRWRDKIFAVHLATMMIPGIANFSNLYTTDRPHQMAAAVVVMLPIVIVFLLAQKYFVKGITMTGLKG